MDSCVNEMICILLFRKVYSLQIQMFGIYLIWCSLTETMLTQGYFPLQRCGMQNAHFTQCVVNGVSCGVFRTKSPSIYEKTCLDV